MRTLHGASLLEQQQQREHLHRLAQAHVVGQTRAQLQLSEQRQPLHAGALIGPQLGLQRLSGVGVPRRSQRLQRLGEPRAGLDVRPGLHVGGDVCVRADACAREQAHALEKRDAVAGLLLHRAPMREHLLQPGSIDFDPLALEEHQAFVAGSQGLQFFDGERFSAHRDAHVEVEHRLEAEGRRLPAPERHRDHGAGRAARLPPVGHPHDHAARLERGEFLQEEVRLARGPREGAEELT